jgi:hypothetical protein
VAGPCHADAWRAYGTASPVWTAARHKARGGGVGLVSLYIKYFLYTYYYNNRHVSSFVFCFSLTFFFILLFK